MTCLSLPQSLWIKLQLYESSGSYTLPCIAATSSETRWVWLASLNLFCSEPICLPSGTNKPIMGRCVNNFWVLNYLLWIACMTWLIPLLPMQVFKMLGNKESLDQIIVATPGLSSDPIALGELSQSGFSLYGKAWPLLLYVPDNWGKVGLDNVWWCHLSYFIQFLHNPPFPLLFCHSPFIFILCMLLQNSMFFLYFLPVSEF